ncbi:MAG: Hsp20/alpha crystallin family protein [Zoogloeaceae bacterium]|jgi:HSP20 family protein|nr:Hsp20/alpha crystallin family protein [Zoogloeaceae bacterium]
MNALTPLHDPLDELFRGFFVRPMDLHTGNAPASPPVIRMDVKEGENAYVVHAELPGVKKEDIHITVDGNLVSISAEVQNQNETRESERVLRSERYYGKVSRSFQLAQDVDDTQSAARFNDGILELTLPKRAAVASKRIAVQ